MHGEILSALCASCGGRESIGAEDITLESVLPQQLRGHPERCGPMWFGSARCPTTWNPFITCLGKCDLFISIGTSGTVYPAASFVVEARRVGAHTVELNLEPSEGISAFREAVHGRATEVVPAYVERLLSRSKVSTVESSPSGAGKVDERRGHDRIG